MNIHPSVSIENVVRKNDDALYFDPVLRTKYYNYYFSYGRHFKPTKVYEIGVRAGYTAYFILLGAAGSVKKYRGIDLETYLHGSTTHARSLLSRLCADTQIYIGDSHKLTDLGDAFDLIHVDGDHTYEGKLLDLELALAHLSPKGVIVVDDCHQTGPKGIVLDATTAFARSNGLNTTWIEPLCGSPQNPVNGHMLITR